MPTNPLPTAPRPIAPLRQTHRNPRTRVQSRPSFIFSSDGIKLECQGVADHTHAASGAEGLAQSVEEMFERAQSRGNQSPLCVGAIPFDVSAPARLFVPERIERHCFPSSLTVPTGDIPTAELAFEGKSDGAGFSRAVEKALSVLKAGQLRKVVLARQAEYCFASRIDPLALARRLVTQNPRALTFALDLGTTNPEDTPGHPNWLVGSSPELLVERTGRYVLTNPLAGTARRGKTPSEERAIKQQLLESSKDQFEHRLVVDAIRSALSPHCRNLSIPDQPSIIETPTLFHLSTLIVGELADTRLSSLDLALLLHPTPAVCGTPTAQARQLALNLEDFDRRFFTGLVGYCDHTGNGRWAVSLRCGELNNRNIRLYAGAGIVLGSTPERELAETDAKLEPMLTALGVPSVSGMS